MRSYTCFADQCSTHAITLVLALSQHLSIVSCVDKFFSRLHSHSLTSYARSINWFLQFNTSPINLHPRVPSTNIPPFNMPLITSPSGPLARRRRQKHRKPEQEQRKTTPDERPNRTPHSPQNLGPHVPLSMHVSAEVVRLAQNTLPQLLSHDDTALKLYKTWEEALGAVYLALAVAFLRYAEKSLLAEDLDNLAKHTLKVRQHHSLLETPTNR